ncbi:acyltransferase family protein [Neptunomonas japonica]|uniref:acyltransferase family protein n=1 Tax=Neptunomonas japonica TaxID=417574 RepID=UPI0022A75E9D|nr:acyltransferase [Neptunomonas japonica]
MRLLAAFQVAIVHGYEHFGVEHGESFIAVLSMFPGVTIFFVISGFLISASWERSSSLLSYFENRFLRIYPALWGCFIFSLLSLFIVYSPQFSAIEMGKWGLAQLTIGQFYNPEFMREYGVGVLNGSLWTIPVEIQFYLILPVLYVLIRSSSWSKLLLPILIFLLVIVNQSYFAFRSADGGVLIKLFGVTVLPYLYIFLLGVLLQRNLPFVEKYLAHKAPILLILYLASVCVSWVLGLSYQGNSLNPISTVILSLLIISMAYSNVGKFGAILKGHDVSYGIYIYHMIFVNILIHLSVFSPPINMLIMLMLTTIVALLSWNVIEKPSLSMKRYSVRDQKNNKAI